MGTRTRIDHDPAPDASADLADLADLVDRVQRALAGAPLVVAPHAGDHAGELAAVAYAVLHGVPTVVTDDPPATAEVAAVMEALLDAEAQR